MKNIFLLAAVLVLTNCQSKPKTNGGNSNTRNSIDTPMAARPAADSPSVNNAATNEKTDMESFGGIKLGMLQNEVVSALGQPDSKTKPVEWEADGLLHEDWTYKTRGIILNMSADKENTGKTKALFSISAKDPCTFKTQKNVGIGSTYAEVYEAYKKDIDSTATDKNQVTVGSVYGGIIFTFKKDKAESIFLGAAAE